LYLPPRLLLPRLDVSLSQRRLGIHTTLRPRSSEPDASPPPPLLARVTRALRGVHEMECRRGVRTRASIWTSGR
jgi:hypothetical protein